MIRNNQLGSWAGKVENKNRITISLLFKVALITTMVVRREGKSTLNSRDGISEGVIYGSNHHA